MSQYEFKECGICAAQPGSPPLCDSCLHNRRVISQLNTKNDKLEDTLDIIKSTIDLSRYD